MSNVKTVVLPIIIYALGFSICNLVNAEVQKSEPIIVNGDRVEYSTDNKEVTATGNVEINYKGAKLTCEQITINTQTKDGVARGHVRLDDQKGVIEGTKLIYNFETKIGTIMDSEFRANPYFGKAKEAKKIGETEFIGLKGYATTCNFDHPHYRIGAKQINLFPQDKIQTKGDTIYVGGVPLLYLSRYNHSLKDKLMHWEIMPGKRKDWGYYLLSAWRYNFTENIKGRIYLDYRYKLGIAEGFGLNYASPNFGKGDYKFYFTEEKPSDLVDVQPNKFQRYFMRWRHKWDIDQATNLTSEFYKIGDEKRKTFDPSTSFLKDYFFREYEKDTQPLTYALFHHNFKYSSMDFLVQKRTNHWFDQLDKLPEVRYTLPSSQIGDSRFYFENSSSFADYGKKDISSPVTPDEVNVTRLDTTNKFSLPTKVSFVSLTPFVASRQTVYDKGTNDNSLPIRTIFYSGADLSTKFYRIFNVKSNFLGMDLNGLRHIITPTIGYAYNHTPTIPSSNIKQIDSIDSITSNNSAALGLSNKLQTKRNSQSVDLVDFLVTSSYIYKPKAQTRHGSYLSDVLLDLKVLPRPGLRMESTATFKRAVNRDDPNYKRFTDANYDISYDFSGEGSIAIGQRYERKAGNLLTASLTWRLNPKWKFSIYQSYNLKKYIDSTNSNNIVEKDWFERQYTVSRDLHCWVMDVSLHTKKGEGTTIYFLFSLKAFPEMQFGFDQSYKKPQSGAQ